MLPTKTQFIRAPHPKTGILPEPSSIQRILGSGWVAQPKIHGHRCQLHVSASGDKVIAYNRHGKLHARAVSEPMLKEILRLFLPNSHWNVIDAEWVKPLERLFVFDFLVEEGKVLSRLAFPERWELLPRSYISPHISTLSVIKDLKGCLKILQSEDPLIEGLVFRSVSRPGFSDTSIIRCRKR